MKFLERPIFTGFMPNLIRKEVGFALSFSAPWNWNRLQTGRFGLLLQEQLQKYFDISFAILFDSGRSGLQIALQILDLEAGDEVLVQAYTCSVVINAIHFAGLQPVYSDIQDDFTLSPTDLEKKITPRTKVMIIQHTFGIPAHLDALLEIAKKHNLVVIEDCAHVIGGKFKEKMLGTFGDMSLLSFGSDKAISCGRGGAILTNDLALAARLKKEQENLPNVKNTKILQQLLTFLLFFIAKPIYNIGIGKVILSLAKKLHITTRIIEPEEKKGKPLSYYPAKLPNALALFAFHQMIHIDLFNLKRMKLSEMYTTQIQNSAVVLPPQTQNIPFLRFPILVKNPSKLQQMAEKEGILLGDWYTTVIAPKDTLMSEMNYFPGSCPNAERLASMSVNLPTHVHITAKDQEKIVKIVNAYAE